MIAAVNWELLIPSTITAVAVPLLGYLQLRTHSKVKAIDDAVNGQAPGTPPIVEKVAAIVTEQIRVKEELKETKGQQR